MNDLIFSDSRKQEWFSDLLDSIFNTPLYDFSSFQRLINIEGLSNVDFQEASGCVYVKSSNYDNSNNIKNTKVMMCINTLIMMSFGYKYEGDSLLPVNIPLSHELKSYLGIATRPLKQAENKNGYVYLIHTEHGVKIGRSKNPKDRTNAISTQLPFVVNKVDSFNVKDDFQCEKYYHNLFKENRLNGEWFNLNENEISFIYEDVKRWEIK